MTCPIGLERVDGACVPAGDHEPVEFDERGHPPCRLAEPGTRLSLDDGCAEGACDRATYPEIVAALGSQGRCELSEVVPEVTSCSWRGDTLDTHFDDTDLDSFPDPGATANGIHLVGWSGTDPRGLGLRVSLACFYEELGEPVEELSAPNGSSERVVSATFFLPSGAMVMIDDPELFDEPDGHVGRLALFAP